jgi:hypothetical protein
MRQLALGFRAALIADDSTQLHQWIEGAKRCEFGAVVRFAYGLQRHLCGGCLAQAGEFDQDVAEGAGRGAGPRPAQDLGEVIVGWQTLKSTERRPYRERLKSAAVTDCCSEPVFRAGCSNIDTCSMGCPVKERSRF